MRRNMQAGLVLALCLSIGMGFAAENTEVLPPGIMPVVILSGSNYEMGVQYGQQAGRYMEQAKQAAWAEALQRFSRAEVIRTLKANQVFMRKYTPEVIDMMKGMADGAASRGFDITYIDAVLLNCTLPKPKTSTLPPGAEDTELPPRKRCSVCSAWGSATTDGRLIGVDTLDSGEAGYGVVIVAFPDDGNNYMCGAMAGELSDHFLMNDKGLFVGNSGGGGSPRDQDNNYGLSWSCSLSHLVRYAGSAEEARRMLMPWQINITENFHLVDTRGGAFVVEKTAAVQGVRKPGDFGEKDFLYSTNNYLHAAMKVTKEGDFIKEHGGYGAYAAPRNLMLWDMLHNYHGLIDVPFAKMMLRFPGSPPPAPPEGGWDAKICRPSNSWVAVLQPDDGDRGVADICTGPAGRVIHSSTASDGSVMRAGYPYIEGSHTFFRLRLAVSPKEMVESARERASETIDAAYAVIMDMNYTDIGYDGLSRLYSQANREFYRGKNAYHRALLGSGNRALEFFAQAASAFARAQARALQVYEAVVPAPTSPSDLGHRPFGKDWASWETRVK